MFSGALKILFLTAPVIAIIGFMVFIKMGSHEAKQDLESAKFDADFAVMQQSMSKTKSEKKHWEAKKTEAIEQIELAKKLEKEATGTEQELNKNYIDAAKEFSQNAKDFGQNGKVDGSGKATVKDKP